MIFWISIPILLALGIIAYFRHSPFYIDSIVALVTTSIFYYNRKRVIFSWEAAMFGCLGFILNVGGAIGTYDLSYHGIGGDKLIHLVSAMGISIFIYSYLASKKSIKGGKIFSVFALIVLTFLVTEGLGGVNEINEFIGSKYFGIDRGMFSMANGSVILQSDFDHYDTQWDMIFNTFGAVLGILYISLKQSFYHKKNSEII